MNIPMPKRIAALPQDEHGRPVPWFVQWLPDGKPDFRVMDPKNWVRAVKERRCWVCGERLGKHLCFVIGPMCAVNRTSSEPPSHLDCGRFSAQACPFLSTPRMHRRERDLPPDYQEPGGISLKRNPGVALLWVTDSYRIFDDGKGNPLIQLGEPTALEAYAEGRPASFAELMTSVDSGMPILQELANTDRRRELALAELKKDYDRAIGVFRRLLVAAA